MPKDAETSYRGQPIKGYSLGITGKITQQVSVDKLDLGDTVQVLVTGTVTAVSHKRDEKLGGLVRSPRVTVNEAHLLGDEDGIELLLELRQRDEELLDALLGRQKLEGFPGAEGPSLRDQAEPGTGELPPRDDE